jgi:hypothetical protein
VYHFELRKFPHTASRFNQSEQQLLALVVPWVREEWVELGERKWNVNETKLTVLEGPELSLQEMAMNRGWRSARRQSEDVTERVLAAAREIVTRTQAPAARSAAAASPATGSGAADGGRPSTADVGLLADALGLEILGALDTGPAPLSRAWQLAAERLGERPASESLALAERATASLLERGLAMLVCTGDGQGGERVADRQTATVLADVESWGCASSGSVAIARKA